MAKTIGFVIAMLKGCKANSEVFFDFGHCIPTTVNSWRGVYAEPALGWTDIGWAAGGAPPKVSDLIAELEKAINGREYTGWKGGKFIYTKDDQLHIDNPGDASGTEISVIQDLGNQVVIHTAKEE